MTRIYLDANATTPPLPEVTAAIARALAENWGNPSSVHADGRRARAVVEDARAEIARLGGVDPRDVLFTSGATEANNVAIRSVFSEPDGLLVTSRLEHPSVVKVAEWLEREGRARVEWLPVTESGIIELVALQAIVKRETVRLVAVQAVNHETGVVQPLAELFALTEPLGIPVHVDAVQAFGRVATDTTRATTRSLAGHKIRGPKGIGVLYTNPCVPIVPILFGGSQERGARPGTTDPALIAGLGVAATHASTGPTRYERVRALRDRLEASLRDRLPRIQVNGDGAARAPHVSNLYIPGEKGPELVAALDLEGISVSSGSACSAGTQEASPVISAMRGKDVAESSVRISLGDWTTDDEVERATATLLRLLAG